MTESLKLEAEARADLAKEQQRVKDEQEWRINATVDEWMMDEAMVENALLEAVKEVSGDIALMIVTNRESSAVRILADQIRKQMQEKAQEHLYG